MRRVSMLLNIICVFFYGFVGKGKENYKQRTKKKAIQTMI